MDKEAKHRDEEALRNQLEQLIEAARSQIEQAIANLTWAQQADESSEQIASLSDQLSLLDEQKQLISGGHLPALLQIQASLPRAISAIRQSTTQAVAQAQFQSAGHLVEMTFEKIQALQLENDAHSAQFQSYEARSFSQIEQLAANQNIDVTGIRTNRARLQVQYDIAKNQNDRAGMFKADALLASNNVAGLVKVDGPQEAIEEARRQAAEARARYLKEKEIEALRAGQAQGLSGNALRSHVDQASQTAASELDTEIFLNAERAGLTPEQMIQAGVVTSATADGDEKKVTILAQQSDQSFAFSIQAKAATSDLISDRAAVIASKPEMKALLAANGIVPPSSGSGLQSEEVGSVISKQPAAVPTNTAPVQDGALIT